MRLKTARALCVLLALWAGAAAWAAQYRLQVGQMNQVPVGIDVRNAETLCNVEIRVDGGPPFQQRVRAPEFMAWLVLTPVQSGPVLVTWRGVFYRNERDELVNPCPTQGQTRFMAGPGNADLQQDWRAWWASQDPAQTQCMQKVLSLWSIKTDWLDRRDPEPALPGKLLARSQSQCERFVQIKTPWGAEPMASHSCTWRGLKTRCEGYYTPAGGKGPRLNYEQALAMHLSGTPLQAGHAESVAAQQARARAAKAAADKALAEENARVEAFKQALAEQKAREEAQRLAQQQAAEEERQKKIKAAEQREREWLENRPWLVRKLSRVQPKPLEEEQAQSEPGKKQP
ncbi:MAG: IgA receptor precursor [Pseudomonadota bacterium]